MSRKWEKVSNKNIELANNKLIKFSNIFMGIILVYISLLLFLLKINMNIHELFLIINYGIILCAIYLAHLPLVIYTLKHKFSKIIYGLLYIMSLVLMIQMISKKIKVFPLIIFIIVFILVVYKKIKDDFDIVDALKKYIWVYIVFALSIFDFFFNKSIHLPTIIFFIIILICLIKYFAIDETLKKHIDIKEKQKTREKNEKYFKEHPEVREALRNEEQKRYEEEKKLQAYLDTVPDYMVPTYLYSYDKSKVKREYSDKHKFTNFDCNTNFYVKKLNKSKYHSDKPELYIEKLDIISKETIYEVCSNPTIRMNKETISFDMHYNYEKIPKDINKDDDKLSEYLVSGFLMLYFNVKDVLKKVYYRDRYWELYLENRVMLFSNKDKTQIYIATLTNEKPLKDKWYVEYMKLLNPNLEKYTDIFGNEIDFKNNN